MKKATAIGNLVKDATINFHEDTSVINFDIAVNESYFDKSGQKVENTTFINCAKWGNKNEKLIDYLKKGYKVYVEGNFFIEIYNEKPNIKLSVTFMEILAAPKQTP